VSKQWTGREGGWTGRANVLREKRRSSSLELGSRYWLFGLKGGEKDGGGPTAHRKGEEKINKEYYKNPVRKRKTQLTL